MSDFINRRKSLRWSGAILSVVAMGMGSLLTVAAPVRADSTTPTQGALSSGEKAMSAWDPIAKAPVALLASPAYQLPTQIYSPHFAVLPDGRFAIPAGKQVTLGNLPVNLALSPNHQWVAVSNSGAGNQSLMILNATTGDVVQTIPMKTLYNGLVFSPDSQTLYVAGGGTNEVFVFQQQKGTFTQTGSIPVSGYPTALALSPDGNTLYVTDNLGNDLTAVHLQSGQGLSQQTVQVGEDPFAVAVSSNGQQIYVSNWKSSSLDEEFGDIKAGNGDPALTLYPAKITPNNHALAEDFGLFNNYYVDGEVTAQEHQWVAGAGPTDYVQRTWAAYYSNRGRTWDAGVPGTLANTDTYGWEQNVYSDLWAGSLPVTYPKLGYLFNDALRAHLSFLDYGEFVEHDPTTGNVLSVLKSHLQANYPGWNLHISDTQRATIFLDNLKKGVFLQFSYVYLMDDHTAGTEPGFPNPNPEVANNDEATGEIVNAISHSKYWKNTAIFVLEDDAQSGGDHVDAHRPILMVASPYARRNVVLNSHYDQMSMLKTIELMLGMPSLTVNDTFATPLWSAFTNKPNFAPYVLQKENVPYQFTANVMNTIKTVDAALSANHPMSQIEQASGAVQRKVLTDYYKNWEKDQG